MMHLPPARRKDAKFEKKVLVTADHVITVGNYLKDLFLNKLGPDSIARNHVSSINNGFDPKDFTLQTRQNDNRKNEVFLLSYIGTMTTEYSLDTLLRALKSIRNSSNPDFQIKMSITGSISLQQKQEIEHYVPVQFNTHVSHQEAVGFMQSSSMLLLIIPRIKHNKGIVTGKIFEYMASGKPILGIGPVDGDASQILSESQSGKMFDYDDFYGIYDYLLGYIYGRLVYSPRYDLINMWSRKEQFRKLIALF
jgi:glycosyltransferase involved in cell wall biosynthesis